MQKKSVCGDAKQQVSLKREATSEHELEPVTKLSLAS